MKLTEKQEEKLTELVTHVMGACECGYLDKSCLFNKISEKTGAQCVALVMKEIKKL